tara:strand:+ start:1034 stop:1459 length:426 start_codon:yes stop_codon:yes gene_type:complete
MPTYTGMCVPHGEFEAIKKASEYIRDGGLFCPVCNEKATTIIRKAPAVIGPLPSKQLSIDQIGRSFSSPEEQRAYFNHRKDRVIVGKDDSAWINHRDSVRNQADRTARKQGFRDHEDRKTRLKKDKTHREAISRGEKKIQV